MLVRTGTRAWKLQWKCYRSFRTFIDNLVLEKSKLVVSEMEKIEEDFYKSYESAREYLGSQKDIASSGISDILSINLQENITYDDSGTYRKEKTGDRMEYIALEST